MASKINCPRCGANNLKEVEEALQAGDVSVTVTKQKCNECDSRFFFEEQIIDYLKAISALIPAKQ